MPTNPTPTTTSFNPLDITTTHCPRCRSTATRQGPGTGPHFAKLECASCGRFLRWLAKPVGTADGGRS
jgi:hypothetical protein